MVGVLASTMTEYDAIARHYRYRHLIMTFLHVPEQASAQKFDLVLIHHNAHRHPAYNAIIRRLAGVRQEYIADGMILPVSRLRAVAAILVALLMTSGAHADRWSRQERRAQRNGWVQVQPARESVRVVDVSPKAILPPPAVTVPSAQGDHDALHEVNASRQRIGLAPLAHDPLMTQAALRCAQERAKRGIAGHLSSDFDYMPSGCTAKAAGCAALEPSWGWQSCCWDDPSYTVGGAAWVMGSDGLRYMHIFVR